MLTLQKIKPILKLKNLNNKYLFKYNQYQINKQNEYQINKQKILKFRFFFIFLINLNFKIFFLFFF